MTDSTKYDPTPGQLERTRIRDEHGRRLCQEMAFAPVDWDYHDEARARLSSSERACFDLEHLRARTIAGVRPAVDIALARMREKLGNRLGRATWRGQG